jgi:hypothetical protein
LSSLSVASAPLRVAGRPAEVWKVYSAHARVHSTVGERRCRVAAGHGGALARHAAAFVIVGPGAGILTPVGALPPGRRRKCAIHVPNRRSRAVALGARVRIPAGALSAAPILSRANGFGCREADPYIIRTPCPPLLCQPSLRLFWAAPAAASTRTLIPSRSLRCMTVSPLPIHLRGRTAQRGIIRIRVLARSRLLWGAI